MSVGSVCAFKWVCVCVGPVRGVCVLGCLMRVCCVQSVTPSTLDVRLRVKQHGEALRKRTLLERRRSRQGVHDTRTTTVQGDTAHTHPTVVTGLQAEHRLRMDAHLRRGLRVTGNACMEVLCRFSGREWALATASAPPELHPLWDSSDALARCRVRLLRCCLFHRFPDNALPGSLQNSLRDTLSRLEGLLWGRGQQGEVV